MLPPRVSQSAPSPFYRMSALERRTEEETQAPAGPGPAVRKASWGSPDSRTNSCTYSLLPESCKGLPFLDTCSVPSSQSDARELAVHRAFQLHSYRPPTPGKAHLPGEAPLVREVVDLALRKSPTWSWKLTSRSPHPCPLGGQACVHLIWHFPVSHVPTDLPGYNSVSGILGPCLSLLCLMQRLDFTTRSHKLKCYSIAGT